MMTTNEAHSLLMSVGASLKHPRLCDSPSQDVAGSVVGSVRVTVYPPTARVSLYLKVWLIRCFTRSVSHASWIRFDIHQAESSESCSNCNMGGTCTEGWISLETGQSTKTWKIFSENTKGTVWQGNCFLALSYHNCHISVVLLGQQ